MTNQKPLKIDSSGDPQEFVSGDTISSTFLPSTVAYTNAINNWSSSQDPTADNTYSLGTGGKAWNTLYSYYLQIYDGSNSGHSTLIYDRTLTADRTILLPDADSNPVQPTTATTSNWITNVDSSGVQHKTQPAFTDISGTATAGQGGTGVTASDPVIQQVRTITGAQAHGTTAVPFDDTIPQITEGDQYMSLAITPKNTANILRIDVTGFFSLTATQDVLAMSLFQDATANALATASNTMPTGGDLLVLTMSYYMTAGTTSATTFKVRAGGTTGTCTFNGVTSARKYGGALCSSIFITEYAT